MSGSTPLSPTNFMKCPTCGTDNTDKSDEELIQMYSEYMFICWYCTTVFITFHDCKVPFVKEILSVGSPKDRHKFFPV